MSSRAAGEMPKVRQNTNSAYSWGKLRSPTVFSSSSRTCSTFFFPARRVVHHGLDRLIEQLIVLAPQLVQPLLGRLIGFDSFPSDGIDHAEDRDLHCLLVVQLGKPP